MNKAVLRILAAICLLGLVSQVSAIPLTFNDVYGLGTVVSGEPASPVNEIGYINTLIDQALGSGPTSIAGHLYTRTSNDFGPLPDAMDDNSVRDESGGSTGIDVTGYQYLLGKYDGPNGGDFIWYVGDLSGEVDIPQTSSPWRVNRPGNGFGLSHWSLYNPTSVPDGSTTLVLLGAALSSLWLVRQKLGRA